MNVEELTRRVAAFGLPDDAGSLRAPVDGQPLDGAVWTALLRQVRRQRLTGYLHAAIETGALATTEPQQRQVDELHTQCCASVLRLERILLTLACHLESANVRFLVLKGTASAHLVHAEPAMRLFGDNDLLFAPEDFDTALEVLYGLGYHRPAAPPHTGFDRRFGKGATLKGPTGDELDAHRNLMFGTFGFSIDVDELFATASSFELGGRRLSALGPETRLLHACYHAALGDPEPRLSSIRDVAQMLATGNHDPQRVLDLVRRWEADAVVARGLMLCRDVLGVAVSGPLVSAFANYEPTRREQRAIASYVGENRSFAAKAVASLPYLHRTRDKAAFLRAIALPSRSFVETRGSRSESAWLGRGFRALLRGR